MIERVFTESACFPSYEILGEKLKFHTDELVLNYQTNAGSFICQCLEFSFSRLVLFVTNFVIEQSAEVLEQDVCATPQHMHYLLCHWQCFRLCNQRMA